MKRSYKIGITAIFCCALIFAGCIAGHLYQKYAQEQKRVKELESQLATLSKKENESAVMQSINAQMEEIATQQRIISDEQREEAEQQTRIANEMRQHAEHERQNALEAERRAMDASEVAKGQRAIAESQRIQAEHSKRVADTLSYLTMARNIASVAITQQKTGNKQLAALLAHASYTFTKRYHGDVYHPTLYEAMTLTSGAQRKWAIAHGYIMKTTIIPGTNSFMSISTYGEIMRHIDANGTLQTKTVYSNNNYDFRDIYFNKERTFYAVSHTGHLVVSKENGKIHVVNIDGAIHPFRVFQIKDDEIIITAEQSVHVFNANTLRPVRTLPLTFKTAVAGWKDGQIALFDQAGNMYLLDKGITRTIKQSLPFKGRVMSYNYNSNTKQQAFGMYDGTIYYFEPSGKMHKLVGHNSRVSRINFDQTRLYSSSYDGTVKYWNINSEKIVPINVINSQKWVISLSFDLSKKFIWTTDQNGNLTETMIDIKEMAQRVKANLKRNLTHEEWNYYIGRNIPYEQFIGKEAKP